MRDERDWNEQFRQELYETLRWAIRGEVRLAKRGHEDILQWCRAVYVQDECPEAEIESFMQFAAEELDRTAAQLASKQAEWSNETDCDRLDRVEVALRERGILLWQVSPCCDTCTGAELPDRIDVIDSRHPGFRDRVRGYGFFIDQNMPEMLSDKTRLSVYLAYGWFSSDNSEVAREVYAENALDIAREICACLRDEGFEVDWNGKLDRKIGISLDWQRRTILQ
jgi:hypothetical protein